MYVYIYIYIYIYISVRLPSGECLKLCKLDVIYSKSIPNDASVPYAGKITLVDMHWESGHKNFDYSLGKLSSAFKPYVYPYIHIYIYIYIYKYI